MVRFGRPVLGALSSGFELYESFQAFDTLRKMTDPKLRQDALVKDSDVSSAGSFELLVRLALLGSGEIYSAIRQVQELKKWVALSDAEELDARWSYFSYHDLAPDVENVAIYQ